MRIILALVLGLTGGLALAQAATTGSASFNLTRKNCTFLQNSQNMRCYLGRVSNVNGGVMEDLVVDVLSVGGPVVATNGQQLSATTPAGITSTCGACPGAIDSALVALCAGGGCTP